MSLPPDPSDSGPAASERPADAEFVDPVDGTRWLVDVDFLGSNWHCIWGEGCEGILDHPAAKLGQGCCSVGAKLVDEDEARQIGALGKMLDPARFQFASVVDDGGVLSIDGRSTRVVDGACIFLNRPGFAGGAGCALHLAAIDEGDSPIDWKPSICWQLPLKVDVRSDGVRHLRRWQRSDWGPGGETMAWCCTEHPARSGRSEPSAYTADQPVVDTLATELRGIVGPEVAVEIRARVAEG